MIQELKLTENYTDGTGTNNVMYSVMYKLITQILLVFYLWVFYIYLYK